jgi:CDP-glucose 4,6-dehydratase
VLEPLGGYLRLAERLYARPEEFAQGWNFGPRSSDAKPVAWIASRIVELWGDGAKWVDGSEPGAPHEAQTLKLDCSLAEARLGWAPQLSLNEALNWTVEWHRKALRGESAREACFAQIARYQDALCTTK